jgi:hypothetical protein
VKLTEIQKARLRGWLKEVEDESERWGDILDPNRTGNDMSRKIDAISRQAHDARFYLDA